MRADLMCPMLLARLANLCTDNAAIYAVVQFAWRREEVHDNASSE